MRTGDLLKSEYKWPTNMGKTPRLLLNEGHVKQTTVKSVVRLLDEQNWKTGMP